MKILGIVGSKRKKGNTSFLVQRALEAARKEGAETEIVFLGDYSFEGCSGCEGCRETYRCIVNDDMQKLYPLLQEADALILGSPTYFYNVTSDVKAFIDRCYCLEAFDDHDRSVWMGISEALGGKYAAVIAVCEQYSEDDMGYTAVLMEKPLQALGYRVVDSVKVLGLFEKGRAAGDKESLQKAEKAGIKLVKTLRLREKIQTELAGSNRLKNREVKNE